MGGIGLLALSWTGAGLSRVAGGFTMVAASGRDKSGAAKGGLLSTIGSGSRTGATGLASQVGVLSMAAGAGAGSRTDASGAKIGSGAAALGLSGAGASGAGSTAGCGCAMPVSTGEFVCATTSPLLRTPKLLTKLSPFINRGCR